MATKRLRDGDDAATPAARKRRRGDPKYERFDVNARPIWEALADLGEAHAVFATEGVVDVVVEYARPLLPLFARVPARVGGQMNLGRDLDPMRNFQRLHGASGVRGSNVSVGTTISCFNPLQRGSRVDAIVVVPPDPRLCEPHARDRDVYVGVIVPVVRTSHGGEQHRFGADRTVFFEDFDKWSESDDWSYDRLPENRQVDDCLVPHVGETAHDSAAPQRDTPTAERPAVSGDQPNPRPTWARPPTEGYYAVHYVNVATPHCMAYNPHTNKYAIDRAFVANSTYLAFPGEWHSRHHRVHTLPSEIEQWKLETRLLNAFRAERAALLWGEAGKPYRLNSPVEN